LASKNGGPIESYAIARFYGHLVNVPTQVPAITYLQGATEWWKDAVTSKAVALGMQVPGAALTDDMVFSTFTGAAWAERMRISNAGLVGIGCTPANAHTLDIYVPTGSGDPAVAVGKDQTNKFGTIGFSDTLDALYLQGGVWGGTTRPLVLQGGGGDVYTVAIQGYTATFQGFNPATPNQFCGMYYKKVGRMVWVFFTFYGASNATNCTFTLPYTASGTALYYSICKAIDNSVERGEPGFVIIDAGDFTRAVLWRSTNYNLWTNTNNKGAQGFLCYEAST